MYLNLLSSAVEGAAYLILLFGMCFGAVVGIKLLLRKLRERQEPVPAQTEEKAPPKSAHTSPRAPRTHSKKRAARSRAQKIYYILERAEADRAEQQREKVRNK